MNTALHLPEWPWISHLKRWTEVVMSTRGDKDRGRLSDPDPPLDDIDRTTKLISREAAKATVEILGGYHEGGSGNDEQSWQNYILVIVGGLITLGIGATVYQLSEIKSQVATIAAKQDTNVVATNQRLEADERRIESLERKVFQ